LFGDLRIECPASDGDGAVDLAAFHLFAAIEPVKLFS
jgi:hypothetical protein